MSNKELSIKEQAEIIYDKLDELARDQDSYDFGLPMFKKETGPIEDVLNQWQSKYADLKTKHQTLQIKSNLIVLSIKDAQKTIDELKAENAALKETAGRMADALKEALPYLKAPGTNGNHWVPTVETALQDWQNKEGV